MAQICPGFMGLAHISGTLIRCTDFTLNPRQDFVFYDHVIGLNDTVPVNSATKGEEVGVIQTQKRIGRPTVANITGGMSFPATESNINLLFNHAKYGSYFDLNFTYYRGDNTQSRTFGDCRVNQYSFSVTAGDIVAISTDIVAKRMFSFGGPSTYTSSEKLITWDNVTISVLDANGGLDVLPEGIVTQALTFSVNNNVTPIYTADPNNLTSELLPHDLRVGMQEVTGSLTFYATGATTDLDDFLSASTTSVQIVIGGQFSTTIYAVLKPRELAGITGPVVVEVPFVGVDKAFGE